MSATQKAGDLSMHANPKPPLPLSRPDGAVAAHTCGHCGDCYTALANAEACCWCTAHGTIRPITKGIRYGRNYWCPGCKAIAQAAEAAAYAQHSAEHKQREAERRAKAAPYTGGLLIEEHQEEGPVCESPEDIFEAHPDNLDPNAFNYAYTAEPKCWRGFTSEGVISAVESDDEMPADISERWTVSKDAREELQDLLDGWVEKHGPPLAYVGGEFVCIRAERLEWLRALGVDVDEIDIDDAQRDESGK